MKFGDSFFIIIYSLLLQGGLSSGYKKYVADKGLTDETYMADGVALIRISGTSIHNNKAIQVEAVCTPYRVFMICIYF